MKQTWRRWGRGVSAAGAVAALFVSTAPGAAAATVGDYPPVDVVGVFADCPDATAFTTPRSCLVLSIYDVDIKIGDTVAHIDGPIQVTVGVGTGVDEEGATVAEIVLGGGAGASPASSGGGGGLGGLGAISIPGGVLGVPELDPLIELAPDLLGLQVAPAFGSPFIGGDDPFGAALALLDWMGGHNLDVSLGLPVSIGVKNLLLGNKCGIPQATILPTTGTTSPPPGVAPMTGDQGESVATTYLPPGLPSGVSFQVWERTGVRLVDNAFSVSGATKCDLLLGDLLDLPSGLFDPLLNTVAGLPSPAGNNHVSLSVDVAMTNYSSLTRLFANPPSLTLGPVFTALPITTQGTVTFFGVGFSPAHPLRFDGFQFTKNAGSLAEPGWFSVVDDGCSGRTLQLLETCQVTVEANIPPDAPAAPSGTTNYDVNLAADHNGSGSNIPASGLNVRVRYRP